MYARASAMTPPPTKILGLVICLSRACSSRSRTRGWAAQKLPLATAQAAPVPGEGGGGEQVGGGDEAPIVGHQASTSRSASSRRTRLTTKYAHSSAKAATFTSTGTRMD